MSIKTSYAPEVPRIEASFDPKPIPTTKFDWLAWYDGYEECGPYGFGSTRDEAIKDLKENYDTPSLTN